MTIEALLPLLVCPLTRHRLQWLPGQGLLVSPQAGLAYRVCDGVPILLPDAAVDWPLTAGASVKAPAWAGAVVKAPPSA